MYHPIHIQEVHHLILKRIRLLRLLNLEDPIDNDRDHLEGDQYDPDDVQAYL